jgi:biopolymer transport protein ExbD
MRKRKYRSQSDELIEEPLINLTSLIDVVFVVLITFMLIAPLLNKDRVTLASGGVPMPPLAANHTPILTIAIHADNSIWVQGKSVSSKQLEILLKEEKKQRPSAIPQIIPDANSHFATYQSIKSLLESVGFSEMEILLSPSK